MYRVFRPLPMGLLFCATAAAQPAAPLLLDEVAVTADRVGTPIERIGSSITVITRAELERQQTRQVIDILRQVPGVTVSRSGSFGGTAEVRIRGTDNRNTVVLIDGVEVSDPSSTQTQFDFAHLLAGDVERIEILRGSQSTLYGGDAIGGVVNIITRAGGGPLRQSLTLEAGSFASNLQDYAVRGGGERLGFAFQVQRFDSNGISAADENAGNDEADAARNVTVSGKLSYQASDALTLRANLRHADADVEFDAFVFPAGFMDAGETTEVRQTSARGAAELALWDGRWISAFGVGYTVNQRDDFSAGVPNFFADGERLKFDYQGTLDLHASGSLVFGAETETERFETRFEPPRDVRISGYYGLYQFDVAEQVFLSLGARLDDHETFGTETTWRATAAWLLDATATTVRGSYGTGFRAPSLFELFANAFGNPDLQPEQSDSFDLGVEQELLDGRLTLGVTWFRIDIENRIAFESRFDAEGNFIGGGFAQVAGRSESRGWELSAAYRPAERLALAATYTYNDAEDSLTGRRFSRRPRHAANLNVDYGFLDGRGQASLNLRYVADVVESGMPLDDYLRADLALSWQAAADWRVFGRIENLTDEEYQEALGFGTPDRSYYLGTALTF